MTEQPNIECRIETRYVGVFEDPSVNTEYSGHLEAEFYREFRFQLGKIFDERKFNSTSVRQRSLGKMPLYTKYTHDGAALRSRLASCRCR